MRNSEIKFRIQLDDKNIPDKIFWEATDSPSGKEEETKSIMIALWDHVQQNTMRIDLWSKEMPVLDMKRFYIESIGGMAEAILNATGDKEMADEMKEMVKSLTKHINKEK
ncbi:MAG TPA: gliding motility protein GldC [Cytophagaceae bacterium]